MRSDQSHSGTWFGRLDLATRTVQPILHLTGEVAEECFTQTGLLFCVTSAGVIEAWRYR